MNPWTPDEDEILIRFFPLEKNEVYKRLQDRSEKECLARARSLRLIRKGLWSEDEDAVLLKYYKVEGKKVAERLPGRTGAACSERAHKLGVYHFNYVKMDEKPKPWSKSEDEILAKYYVTEGRKVAKRLPGRTHSACGERARVLGVRHFRYTEERKRGKPWSMEENAILTKFYEAEGSNVCARLPGRTRRACNGQARLLGLHYYKKEYGGDK